MVRVQVVADLVRKKALAVRQTGYYCSIFECVVIAYLRNVRVKVLFGAEQVDMYDRFKDDLAPQPPREKKSDHGIDQRVPFQPQGILVHHGV